MSHRWNFSSHNPHRNCDGVYEWKLGSCRFPSQEDMKVDAAQASAFTTISMERVGHEGNVPDWS